MRAKFAVFIAIAIVFAPGSAAERVPYGKTRSADIGARMLAPTFHYAAERNTGSFYKRLHHLSRTDDASKVVPWDAAVPAPQPPDFIVAVVILFSFLGAAARELHRSGRAPPRSLAV